ncbi:four-carbon acid sugar kinase family protein [Pseudoroseomonas wenyumeiae]
MPRWLILADDLTGAADCAVAFARRGHAAAVTWAEIGERRTRLCWRSMPTAGA